MELFTLGCVDVVLVRIGMCPSGGRWLDQILEALKLVWSIEHQWCNWDSRWMERSTDWVGFSVMEDFRRHIVMVAFPALKTLLLIPLPTCSSHRLAVFLPRFFPDRTASKATASTSSPYWPSNGGMVVSSCDRRWASRDIRLNAHIILQCIPMYPFF